MSANIHTLASLRSQAPSYNYSTISEKEKADMRHELVTAVAYATLKEFVVSMAFTAISLFFVASAASGALLITGAFLIVIFNAAVRGIAAKAKYEAFLLKDLPAGDSVRLDAEKFAARMETAVDHICPITFATIDSNTRDLVTHEAGHALATYAVYKNPMPSITIQATQPFSAGGVTRFYPGQLTGFGEKIGRTNASSLVAAAGPAMSLTFSCVNLVVAHKIKDSHPRLSLYFLAAAITSIAQHVLYALSALWMTGGDLGHDFIRLWAGGVHPIISAITLIAIPLLVKGALLLYDYHKT